MVKLRSDQERVKSLLKDTITLLCKNGLEYKSRFCINAVVGITVDEEDVFLVTMNETISEKGLINNGAPVHLPPAPVITLPTGSLPQGAVFDMQALQKAQLQTQVSHEQIMATVPHLQNFAQLKAQKTPVVPTVPFQSTPLSLSGGTLNQKRRRSASPSPRPEWPSSSVDIPEPAKTPGAISSDSSNQSVHVPQQPPQQVKSSPTPISVQPETIDDDDDDDDEPQNLVIKEEQPASDTENQEQEQAAPLNMSMSQEEKNESENAVLSQSQWDPANIQQQVAQAAKAAISIANSPATSLSNSPAPAQTSAEQDSSNAATWSLLKSALNTPQLSSKPPTPSMTPTPGGTPVNNNGDSGEKKRDEDGASYFYTVSQQQFSVEKRYVCDFAGCNYTSSRKYNLMRHGRTHHEDQRIPCPECPGTFVDKYILKEHMASAHAKFTVPIEGTNMMAVGIGNTGIKPEEPVTSAPLIGPLPEGALRPLVPSSLFSAQTNKRKRSTPNHNPSPKSKSPRASSPAAKPKKSGWHIPRLSPMVMSSADSPVPPVIPSMEQMMSIMNKDTDLEPNNNNVKDSPLSVKDSLSMMRAVFPGMEDAMALDNNNDPKPVASPPSSPPSNANMPVFPGMEMEQPEEEEGGSNATSPEKDRSMIETSDGENAKDSE